MFRRTMLYLLSFIVCGSALADLQNVSVDGQIRIRARYWSNQYVDNGRETRIPDFFLPGRAIGPFGAASSYSLDDKGNVRMRVEQSTKLRFTADFTDNVLGVIELDDTEVWGDGDFRSDYISGVDSRANSGDDVEVLQSYIETDEMFGLPLRLRIGRQQLKLANGWLVGETQSTTETSFDGVRATYGGESFSIDGWWTKLAERGTSEEDGDIDFYGLTASCTALDDHEFLLYWLYLRDAGSLNDTNFAAPIEWLEDVFSLDDYDSTNLHTFGFRATGKVSALDYSLDLAYQTGNADSVGFLFKPASFLYGDDSARFDAWAGDLEVGYAFENTMWVPRVYIGGAYFGGEDNRDLSFGEWLNPFDRPESSISFNRLFSSTRYTEVFDEGRNGSNFNQVRAGVDLHPTESVTAKFEVAHFRANEAFDYPLAVDAGPFRIPVAPALPFLTTEVDKEIGTVTDLTIEYQYSEELLFRLIWQHHFTGGEMDKGQFVFANGLELLGGSDNDDLDYIAFESKLKF